MAPDHSRKAKRIKVHFKDTGEQAGPSQSREVAKLKNNEPVAISDSEGSSTGDTGSVSLEELEKEIARASDREDSQDDDSDSSENSELSYETARRLHDVLLNTRSLSGTFAYSETFHSTPNPGISIKNHGILHLPVSDTEAESLKTRENRQRDKSTRIWPSLVEFLNPEWDKWLQSILPNVGMALGMGPDAKLDVNPRGILINSNDQAGRGDTRLPKARETGDGVLEIILPCEYEGGEFVLTHERSREKVEGARRGQFDVTVTAWYHDVTFEAAPVTSGNRVSLQYQLSSRIIPKPTASKLLQGSQQLWNAMNEVLITNKPMAFVLHGNYRSGNIGGDKITENLNIKDRELILRLTEVIKEVGGLGLYLGSLVTRFTRYNQVNGRVHSLVEKEEGVGEYEYIDVEDAPLSFSTGKMIHLAGPAKAFGFHGEWEGSVFTFGKKLSEVMPEYEEEEPVHECGLRNGPIYERCDNEPIKVRKQYRSTCIFLYPVAHDLSYRFANFQTIDKDLIELDVVPQVDIRSRKGIWDAVLKKYLMYKDIPELSVIVAGQFLKVTLKDMSSDDLLAVANKLDIAVTHYWPIHDEVVYEKPCPNHELLNNFLRIFEIFPVEVSTVCIKAFYRLLESKFFIAEDNTAAVRSIFKIVDWDPDLFDLFLQAAFSINPSENFRREIDRDMRIHLPPSHLEKWIQLSPRCHQYIVDGIHSRLKKMKEPIEDFTTDCRCEEHRRRNYQVIGYSEPYKYPKTPKEKLKNELIDYLLLLEELDHPDSEKLVTRFLEAVRILTGYPWALEIVLAICLEIKNLPPSSRILSQVATLQSLFLAYKSAIIKLHPIEKSQKRSEPDPPPSLPCDKKKCKYCPQIDTFFRSSQTELVLVSDMGDKSHLNKIGQTLKSEEWKDLVEVSVDGYRVTSEPLVLKIDKIEDLRQKSGEGNLEEVEGKKRMLEPLGWKVGEDGKVDGGVSFGSPKDPVRPGPLVRPKKGAKRKSSELID